MVNPTHELVNPPRFDQIPWFCPFPFCLPDMRTVCYHLLFYKMRHYLNRKCIIQLTSSSLVRKSFPFLPTWTFISYIRFKYVHTTLMGPPGIVLFLELITLQLKQEAFSTYAQQNIGKHLFSYKKLRAFSQKRSHLRMAALKLMNSKWKAIC